MISSISGRFAYLLTKSLVITLFEAKIRLNSAFQFWSCKSLMLFAPKTTAVANWIETVAPSAEKIIFNNFTFLLTGFFIIFLLILLKPYLYFITYIFIKTITKIIKLIMAITDNAVNIIQALVWNFLLIDASFWVLICISS